MKQEGEDVVASSLVRRLVVAAALMGRAAPAALAGYVVLTLAMGSIPVLSAWLTKLVIDDLVAGNSGPLVALTMGLGACGVVTTAAPHLTRYLREELERAVGLLTGERLFDAVDRFAGLGRFEDPQFLDRLRLAKQTGHVVPSQAVDGVLAIVRGTITISGFVGSMFVLSPLMTALVLVGGVPTLFAEIWLSRGRARMLWSVGTTERLEFFYSELLSSVEAAKEIRLFGIGAFLRGRMLDQRQKANNVKRSFQRREVVMQAGLSLLAAAVSAGGLLWAVIEAGGGRLSVGDITIFVAAVAGVQGALTSLATQTAQAHHALLLFDHYVAVTAASPDLMIVTQPRPLPPLREALEFHNVWFRYSDDHPWVLQGVNLRLSYGTSLGIVGLNGAGKSTLVKLLCRFYDPVKGSITWDGVDLRNVDPAALRDRIGAVFQDYMQYDLSASDNIALGDLTAMGEPARIEAAARRSGIHDKLVSLPQGYDTLLTRMFFVESNEDDSEIGVVLSGGQWQRLALARAFLRDRHDLMILDEPSAGLDAEAEHEIHTSIRAHRQGRTSLLISHRLGAVREADQIVVLSGGKIAEQGTHAHLLAVEGEYARLFKLQAAGYQKYDDATAKFSG